MIESKHDKFIRLAEARTNKILDMLKLLGNCSNKNVYDYTAEDVDKIFSAIECSVKEARRKYVVNETVRNSRFSLK